MIAKLDLGKRSLDFMVFRCEIALPEQLLVQVETLAPGGKKEGGFFSYSADYTISRTRHDAHVNLVPLDEEGRYSVNFMYSTRPPFGQRRAKDLKAIEAILRCLSTLKQEVEYDCRADFEYKEGADKSLIHLPVQMFAGQTFPFTHIDGMRIAKREGQRTLYSAIIEAMDSELHHSLSFNFVANFSVDLPQRILSRAVEISSLFLTDS